MLTTLVERPIVVGSDDGPALHLVADFYGILLHVTDRAMHIVRGVKENFPAATCPDGMIV